MIEAIAGKKYNKIDTFHSINIFLIFKIRTRPMKIEAVMIRKIFTSNEFMHITHEIV